MRDRLSHPATVAVHVSTVTVMLIGSPQAREYLSSSSVGTTMQNLNQGILANMSLAVPPVKEQQRIVNRVDELMAVCDQLEGAQTERKAARDRLAAASLARANTPNSDTFQDDSRFALSVLPILTTRDDQIEQVRQTILNLAMRGKLVPQDPNNEPASELLKRIALEKARLVKAGEIKKEKELPSIREDSSPFELPSGWSWARLGHLSKVVTSGSRDWAEYYAEAGAIFVRMGNLSRGSYNLRLSSVQRVNPPRGTEGARTRLEAGDVLISITGEVGLLRAHSAGLRRCLYQPTHLRRAPDARTSKPVHSGVLRSPLAQDQFNAPQRGIKNSFRLTDVTELLVPLPPLVEQHRIVAKVDELMAVCDRLEAELAVGAATSSRLLESLLHEALMHPHAAKLVKDT